MPIGAQTEHERDELAIKFSIPCDADDNFAHFGTHFSNPGIVSYFLLRLQPFQSIAMAIQGGTFDDPNRLFNSLQAAWESSQRGLGDVKELIPEMFYLPDIFVQKTRTSFGTNCSNQSVIDVFLPDWAQENPGIFIMKHRLALESAEVSSKLNCWVDLIFGNRQKQKTAFSVYSYTTYEKEYNEVFQVLLRESRVEEATSLVERAYHFGQCPMQIFRNRHEALDKPTQSCIEDLVHDTDSIFLKNYEIPIEGRVCAVFVAKANHTILVVLHKPYFYVYNLSIFDVPPQKLELKKRGCRLERLYYYNVESLNCIRRKVILKCLLESSTFDLFQDQYIVSGRHLNSSIIVHDLRGKVVKEIAYHSSIVSTVCCSSALIYSGGLDNLVACWDLTNPSPHTVYLSHTSPIASLAVSESFCLLISSDINARVLVHEMRTAETLYALQLTQICKFLFIELGFFLSYTAHQAVIYSLNGDFVSDFQFKSEARVVKTTKLGALILVGTYRGIEVYDATNPSVPIKKMHKPEVKFLLQCSPASLLTVTQQHHTSRLNLLTFVRKAVVIDKVETLKNL